MAPEPRPALNVAEFDKFAEEYLADHAANIAVSGESPDYFARYKVDEVRRRWDRLGLAEPRAILRLVLTDAVRIGVSGLALGTAAALACSRLLGSLLFGVTANDPIAYSAAIGTLGLSVLLASWLPARRAAKTAPMDILRVE